MKSLGSFCLSQIIPANGVVAVFDISEEEVETLPVICWGLIMNQDGSKIMGMVLGEDKKKLISVEERGKFLNYELMEWGLDFGEEGDDIDEEEGSLN